MTFLSSGSQPAGYLEQIVHAVYCESAYREQLNLYQMLNTLNIHFAQIDAPSSTYNQMLAASSSSYQSYSENEKIRINFMVENTFKEIEKHFPSGGLIVISTGNNHAHRLAAHLVQRAQSNSSIGSNMSVHVFNCRSNYDKEWQEDAEFASGLTIPLDSAEIKQIYQSLPCPTIYSVKNDDTYCFPALESLVDKIINDSTFDKLSVSTCSKKEFQEQLELCKQNSKTPVEEDIQQKDKKLSDITCSFFKGQLPTQWKAYPKESLVGNMSAIK